MAALFEILNGDFRRERVFRERLNILEIMDEVSIVERYRLSKTMIKNIIENVRNLLQHPTKRSNAVSVEVQVLVALRYYSKDGFLSEIADLHGVSRSTASRCVTNVTDAIYTTYKNTISFPDEVDEIKVGFHAMGGMPNVVGCIDSTLVPIQGPMVDEHVFVCRKGYYAINVQAISDHKLRFINCICKWPGSVHDSFILNNSEIARGFEAQEMDGWLLGDSGYPLRPWLLTPVNVPTTHGEERYNISHKRTRNSVERAFGVLKSRFRCLHKSTGCLLFSPEKCCKLIYVCFILHNMCINNNIALEDIEAFDDDQEDGITYNGTIQDGTSTRAELINLRFE